MPFKFPYENGYSTAGRVVQVGPDAANDFAIGDRVCLGTANAECMSASAHICLIILKIALTDISRLLGRTFADTASSKDGVWKIPDGVPDELAAWVFVLGVGSSRCAGPRKPEHCSSVPPLESSVSGSSDSPV